MTKRPTFRMTRFSASPTASPKVLAIRSSLGM